MTNYQPAGTEYIGSLPTGSHLCAFHSANEVLDDTLGPYFAAGLEQDELCLWMTSDPRGVDAATTDFRKAVPYLGQYIDSGQIEIWDYRDWYLRGGHFDGDRVIGQWVEKEKRSLDSGYKGLRLSGDTSWVEKRQWAEFMAYEAEVNRAFPQHRMIGLCTYPLDGCSSEALLEVIRNHQFTLARITGEWEMIESSSLKVAKGLTGGIQDPIEETAQKPLQPLSADFLEKQDNQRRWLAKQLHEVTAQNVSAIAIYLADLQQRRSWPSAVKFVLAKCHTLCEESLEQILTLSHLLHPPILDELGLAACLRRYLEDFEKRSRIHVEFETGLEIGRLPLQLETHLFRVAQEGVSNIVRHSGSVNAIVRLQKQDDQVILQIEDFGFGMPANAMAPVSDSAWKGGLGIRAMQERLRKIGGQLEIQSSDRGTLLTASIPIS